MKIFIIAITALLVGCRTVEKHKAPAQIDALINTQTLSRDMDKQTEEYIVQNGDLDTIDRLMTCLGNDLKENYRITTLIHGIMAYMDARRGAKSSKVENGTICWEVKDHRVVRYQGIELEPSRIETYVAFLRLDLAAYHGRGK
jgi:hypothetical protein